MTTGLDAMNDALEICSDLGFDMAPGFATHWAMGAETIIRLGYPELVHDWATRYRVIHKHFPRPASERPIDPADDASWMGARGDFSRVGDWQAVFDRALAEQPWREVLATWWPRLISGMAAGLTHGLIRTTHAVRSIAVAGDTPSALQLHELATGLAYWAGKYVEQPGPASLAGDDHLPDLIADIPRLEWEGGASLRDKGSFQRMREMPGWPAAISRLAKPEDISSALSDLTLSFVQVNLAHPDQFPVPLIHGVTAPAALRLMLQYLPEHLHTASFLAVWQADAALLSCFAPPRASEIAARPAAGEVETLEPAELAARAVEHGDEHAIKLTEACLREYALRPDERYLLLPERMLAKIPRPPKGPGH
jgi:hypothetical protein